MRIVEIEVRELHLIQPTHVGQRCVIQLVTTPPVRIQLVAGLLDGVLGWHVEEKTPR